MKIFKEKYSNNEVNKFLEFEQYNRINISEGLRFENFPLIRNLSNGESYAISYIDSYKKKLKKDLEEFKILSNTNGSENWNTNYFDGIFHREEINYYILADEFFKYQNEKLNNEITYDRFLIILLLQFFTPEKLLICITSNSWTYSLDYQFNFLDSEVIDEKIKEFRKLSAIVIKENQIKNLISCFSIPTKNPIKINYFCSLEVLDVFLVKVQLKDLLRLSPSYKEYKESKSETAFLKISDLIAEIDIYNYYLTVFERPIPREFEEEEILEDKIDKVLKEKFNIKNEKIIKISFKKYIEKILNQLNSDKSDNIYFSELEIEIPFYDLHRFTSISLEKKLRDEFDLSNREYDEEDYIDDSNIDLLTDGLDDFYCADPDWEWNID